MKKEKKFENLLEEELKVLKSLQHPNVAWLEEIINDPNKDHIYLVTEYYKNGSLGDKVNDINEKHKQKCEESG